MTRIAFHIFNAEDVLEIAEVPPKLRIPFLNWRIRAKRERDVGNLKGPGLYIVAFEGLVIYAGMFCGSTAQVDAPYSGNIVDVRWWAHFGSLTARSHRLHVSESVRSRLYEEQPNSRLFRALAEAPMEIVTHKQGCLATEMRLRFADRNWDLFGTASPSQVLNEFQFGYAQLKPLSFEVNNQQLRKAIEASEEGVKQILRPVANGDDCSKCNPRQNVTLDEAMSRLGQELKREVERIQPPQSRSAYAGKKNFPHKARSHQQTEGRKRVMGNREAKLSEFFRRIDSVEEELSQGRYKVSKRNDDVRTIKNSRNNVVLELKLVGDEVIVRQRDASVEPGSDRALPALKEVKRVPVAELESVIRELVLQGNA